MSFHCRRQPSVGVLQLSLSFAVLDYVAPCYPTMSSLRLRFCLPADLKPFGICKSVLLILHLLSFIRATVSIQFSCRFCNVISYTLFVLNLMTTFHSLSLIWRSENFFSICSLVCFKLRHFLCQRPCLADQCPCGFS